MRMFAEVDQSPMRPVTSADFGRGVLSVIYPTGEQEVDIGSVGRLVIVTDNIVTVVPMRRQEVPCGIG
jgi:hypothetical protein